MDQQWEQLRQRCLACRACSLAQERTQVVFGVGDPAAEVLLGGLPVGIRAGELNWEAISWEKATGMFLRRGGLHCQAVFTARSQEDGTAFLDFTLKGVVCT